MQPQHREMLKSGPLDSHSSYRSQCVSDSMFLEFLEFLKLSELLEFLVRPMLVILL